MPKTYKSFVKEYAMGLQVPSMSYMKPTGSLTPSRIHGNIRKHYCLKINKE